MSDSEQPSPESDRTLGNVFFDVTGETTITNQQDQKQETSKKVLNDTDSSSSQGEK